MLTPRKEIDESFMEKQKKRVSNGKKKWKEKKKNGSRLAGENVSLMFTN